MLQGVASGIVSSLFGFSIITCTACLWLLVSCLRLSRLCSTARSKAMLHSPQLDMTHLMTDLSNPQ